MAANRGFLRTDLETILLFHRATPRDGSESRTDLETILLSLFFGCLGSSPLCQANPSGKMLGSSMTCYEYLRLNQESKRFDLLIIIATRPRRTLHCSSYLSKTKSYTRPFYLSFFQSQL